MVLLTGAAGYIGSVLRETTADIIGIDNYIKPRHEKAEGVIAMDINQTDEVSRLMYDNRVDAVINLAAVVGDPACAKYPKQTCHSNIDGVASLLEACKMAGVRKFVQASTCSVYGFNEDIVDENTPVNPLSLYAETKVRAENMVKASGLDYSILRFSTAFGWSPAPRFDLTVNEFTRDVFFGRTLDVYRENDWRPYAHTTTLAAAALLAAMNGNTNGTYNVGHRQNCYTKRMLVDTLSKYKPVSVTYTPVADGQDARNYKPDFSLFAQRFPIFSPHTVDDGMIEIMDNLKEKGIDADSGLYRSDCLHCETDRA